MGCQILHNGEQAVLFCSTSDWAFGPVFSRDDYHDADERAEAFLRFLQETDLWAAFDKEPLQTARRDARMLTDNGLQAAYAAWLAQEADQWAREDAALFAEEEDEDVRDTAR